MQGASEKSAETIFAANPGGFTLETRMKLWAFGSPSTSEGGGRGEEPPNGHRQLDAERTARVRAETLLAEARRNMEEQRELLDRATRKLTDTFGSPAGEALKSNSQACLALARQMLEAFVAEAKGDLGQRQQAIP